jgi:hypothetical protein
VPINKGPDATHQEIEQLNQEKQIDAATAGYDFSG